MISTGNLLQYKTLIKKQLILLTVFYFFKVNISHSQINLSNNNILECEIILLGEQTHRDGAVFDEKVKIIKELHKNHNFNIIVFESGLYDNFKAHQLFRAQKEKINIYHQSIFSMWSSTKAFQELLNYVEENPEIKILGFDSQESYLFENFYLEDLKNVLSKYSIMIKDNIFEDIDKVLIFKDFEEHINKPKEFEKLLVSFEGISKKLRAISNKNLEERVITQAFISTLADLKLSFDYQSGKKIVIQNPRDKQMAENFIFLKNQFPNEKFIAWGASYHFANNLSGFSYTSKTEDYIKKQHKLEREVTKHDDTKLPDLINQIKELKLSVPMGKILKDKYKNKLYSIAFTSFEGEYKGTYDKNFKIAEAPKNSIEKKLQNAKKHTLIDLNQYKHKEFYASVLGYLPLLANWQTIFDGIYYIPKMYPPTYIEYLPNTFNNQKLNKAKQIVKGKILDTETKEPIGYSDVYYQNSNKSVVSNVNGTYSIDRSKSKNDFIFFSSVGYETDSVKINNVNTRYTVFLKPANNSNTLDEVVITGKTKKLTASEIVKKARESIKNNYIQNPYNQILLVKNQIYSPKGKLTFNEQALVNTYNKKGINGSSNAASKFYSEIQHLTNTTNNFSKAEWSGVGNLWVSLNRDIILSKTNVLYRTNLYDVYKEGIVSYDGRQVYKMRFVNNSPGSYSTGFGYPAPEKSYGIIYIDRETFAVLKYEHCIVREKSSRKRAKYDSKTTHKIVQTYKKVDGTYFFNLLEVNNKTNHYTKDTSKLVGTSYMSTSIVSQDIETENIVVIEKPIRKIKKGYKYKKEDDYWLGKDVGSKIFDGEFNCKEK